MSATVLNKPLYKKSNQVTGNVLNDTFTLNPHLNQILDRFNRDFIGFNDLRRVFSDNSDPFNSKSYPPYNIEQIDEEHWQIVIAVAGFSEEDLSIILEDTKLTISGKIKENREQENTYLYRGIAERAFERKFILSEGVEIKKAYLQDGLLTISLERIIPESKKPRLIEIQSN